jgi:hypothetical protein
MGQDCRRLLRVLAKEVGRLSWWLSCQRRTSERTRRCCRCCAGRGTRWAAAVRRGIACNTERAALNGGVRTWCGAWRTGG